jgi:hypothetical protein
MRPNAEAWTVVLVGQWNPAVFNPEWVARNLNDGQPVVAELAAGPGLLAIAGWRVVVGDLLVVPSRDRLVFGTRATTNEALQRIEGAARRVLELLPHTPLHAAGVNFAFVEETPREETLGLVKAADLRRFAEKGYDVVRNELHRAVRVEKETLNTVVAVAEDGTMRASVNFHRDLGDVPPDARAPACREALAGKLVRAKKQAVEVLHSVYGLELVEEAE